MCTSTSVLSIERNIFLNLSLKFIEEPPKFIPYKARDCESLFIPLMYGMLGTPPKYLIISQTNWGRFSSVISISELFGEPTAYIAAML